MFLLRARKNNLEIVETETITSGSVNVCPVKFELSYDWDGLSRTAVFAAGTETWSVPLDAEDQCMIPREVLTKPGFHLFAGVCGKRDNELVLPTVLANLGKIRSGAAPGETFWAPASERWRQELDKKGDSLAYDGLNLSLMSGDKSLSAVQITGGGEGGVTPNIQATAATLPVGSDATVTRTGSNVNPVFHFGIPEGEPGKEGDPGPGVPPGGSPGQVLSKKTAADYDTQWSDPAGGGADITPGDGLSKDGDTLSVSNPVRGIYTQAEFDVLPEAQKKIGTYFVGDGGNDAANLLRIISNGGALGLPVGPMGPAGPDGCPVGTVISYMGTTAPKDYLICDGAQYSISQYPALAALFQAQFGTANHFGGDGTTTFAVPDMRNLFLRGYHGDAEEQLAGDVGEKQEATQHLRVEAFNDRLFMASEPGNDFKPVNPDRTYSFSNPGVTWSNSGEAGSSSIFSTYTGRPVNMAVLYCIKAVDSVSAGDVYSTEETRIGTWIDGKPLYRRVLNGTLGSVGTWTQYPEASDIGTLVRVDGYVVTLDYETLLRGSNTLVGKNRSTNVFSIFTNSNSLANSPFSAVLEYTKTTDQATGELPAMLTSVPEKSLFAAAPQSAAAVTLDTKINIEEA